MKVLFAGPSLFGVTPDLCGLSVCAPATQGDIAKAVLEGATAIGLVDGYFDAVAAPWHKEILFALSNGVAMLGSSSMGALRAAECASFGMRPIGLIAEAYRSGALDDDAAVALVHGPGELGYPALSEPLVDIAPTLERMRDAGCITEAEHRSIWARARELHFKDRTDEVLFAETKEPSALAAYRTHRVSQKTEDALLLIAELKRCPDRRVSTHTEAPVGTLFSTVVLPALIKHRQGE